MMPSQKVAITVGHTSGVAQAPAKENDRRHLRGKKGGLRDMPTMPLDILLEIFCQLEPRDLLNLARTTKPFRQFLISRSSAGMWKAARENIEGLPDCPPHLSEPAYANLAFFPNCHCCLKSNVQTVLWEFSARYCPACAKDLTMVWKDIFNSVQYCWAIECSDYILYNVVCVNRRDLYHCPELDSIEPMWRHRHQSNSDWTAFAEAQYQRVKAVREHALLCRAWEKQRAANRSEELQKIREQRLAIIVSKLRDLGWGEELDIIACSNYEPLSEHTLVRPSKPLTDRAWKKIQDSVVAYMEEIKTARIRSRRARVISGRLAILKTVISAARAAPPKRTAADEYKPRLPDLAMMPELRTVVEQPDDAIVDRHTFEALLLNLPAWEHKWRDESTAELLQTLRSGSDFETREGVDPLKLARTMFTCKRCRHSIHYPTILSHECIHVSVHSSADACSTREPGDIYFCCILFTSGLMPWRSGNFEVSPFSSTVDMIVTLCGKAPSTATHEEMDHADPRLAHGDKPGLSPTVMSWRRAIKHYFTRSDPSAPELSLQWLRPATEQEREAVRAREVTQKAHILAIRELWRCGYCDARVGSRTQWRDWSSCASLADMKNHLETQHGVTNADPEQGVMYVHPDLNAEILFNLNPILVKEV